VPYKDPEVKRARNRAYKAAHREVRNARWRARFKQLAPDQLETLRAAGRERAQRLRAAPHEELLARRRAWYAANAEEERARDRAWKATHQEQIRAQALARYHADPAKARANQRKSKESHPDTVRAAVRSWRLAHPDEIRAYARSWYAAHRERVNSRVISLGNEMVYLGTMPPEFREVALLLKEWRKVIRQQTRGETP